jgi:hypothetical protein
MSSAKTAFNQAAQQTLAAINSKLEALKNAAPGSSALEDNLLSIANMTHTVILALLEHIKSPGAGGTKETPNLHGMLNRVNTPAGTPRFIDILSKLNNFFKGLSANHQKDPAMLTKLVRTQDFLKDLQGLVGLVANTPVDNMDPKFVKDFQDTGVKLLATVQHATANPADTSRHMLAADGDLTMDDIPLDSSPESLPEPAPEPTADKPAAHEPPAGGAEGMMGSIDSLVTSIDAFLDNLPVTAFHDRDAEKAARARAKATELRDDVLIIRKQVSDTRAAINGDPGHTERFASLARNVALKFATTAAGK